MTENLLLSALETNQEAAYISEVIRDYWICCISREASLVARREVLTGKAKFAIIGDGKEVPQVAMARAFRKGDFRSGYYRDQTLMFALGLSTLEEFFAQLYADTENDPFSGGRQMNNHFSTPLIEKETGEWTNHRNLYNITSDISSTGGQMARAMGLALASKKYREHPTLADSTIFSDNGNEVCFVTIGDASTSEGIFWETLNAAGVIQVPLAISVWDDGYGISVPVEYQTTKGSISKVLQGFQPKEGEKGCDIYTVKGWDYPALCEMYEKGIEKVRTQHTPALFHVQELTQPQGHSTSGSHERYKSVERLEWEKQHDCIQVMRGWMLENKLSTEEELSELEEKARNYARECRDRAWSAFTKQIVDRKQDLVQIYNELSALGVHAGILESAQKEIREMLHPGVAELMKNAKHTMYNLLDYKELLRPLRQWIERVQDRAFEDYHSNLYSQSSKAALNVPIVAPKYSEQSPTRNGYEVLNLFWDKVLDRYPNLYAFGEDVGKIGGVNQAFMGMQTKYGEERIFDTGIREWTIMGQAIGMNMRGLRTIAEIQYLDYMVFGLVPLVDDLTTLRYRSDGIQQSPAIIRTRGHRLEGIWHSGSPMGMLVHALRGMYFCVPRNFVQAAGMYNTLLQSDDPALVVEVLNGYRQKERLPDNVGDYTVPLGIPEVLKVGKDITLVTYGACVRIAQEALKLLEKFDISVELIDIQTLIPFDLEQHIVESVRKTNRLVILDEDVPGGASSFILQEIVEKQRAYRYLDSEPRTITAKEHRPPYGSDGDYFSKPNAEDVFEAVYQLMQEAMPLRFEKLF